MKKIKSYTKKNKDELLENLENLINDYTIGSSVLEDYINLYKGYETDKYKTWDKKNKKMVYKFKLVANKFIEKSLDYKDNVSILEKFYTNLDKENKKTKDKFFLQYTFFAVGFNCFKLKRAAKRI